MEPRSFFFLFMAWVCVCSFGCVGVWPCSLSGLGAGGPLGRGSVAAGGCAVRALLCWAAARWGPGLVPRVPGAGIGRGARHLVAFIGRFRRRGFVGLGSASALLSSRRGGACVLRSWRWPGFGSVGSRCWGRSGSAVCISACMRVKEC